MTRNIALGIINEIADAAGAVAWKDEMILYMKKNNAVHPDVIEFYTMGDMPEKLDQTDFMGKLTDTIEEKMMKNYFKPFREAADPDAPSPKPLAEPKYSYRQGRNHLSSETIVDNIQDVSSYTDEIDVVWTWGMKYLFQAFSLQRSETKGEDGVKEWRLWPFAQPNLNNRQIDIDQYLWNDKDPTTEQMIPCIFKKTGNNFSSQQVYVVPYIVKPYVAPKNVGDFEPGIPLMAMVEGVGDDLVFDDLSAFKCTRAEMANCYRALTVRSHPVLSLIVLCKVMYSLFLTNLLQGYHPYKIFSFSPEVKDSRNRTMLTLQAMIGSLLVERFNSLDTVEDWEKLHDVLTMTYHAKLEVARVGWDVTYVIPANLHDLLWKTKIRFLTQHGVRNSQEEGQKRLVSMLSALMGIRPVKRLDDCKVRDTSVRIPSEMDELATCDDDHKTEGGGKSPILMLNQATPVPMTIGLLAESENSDNFDNFDEQSVSFYKSLSRTKAEAASKAEERSWKDFALSLSESSKVLQSLLPADFNINSHRQKTPSEAVAGVAKQVQTEGRFINKWGTKAIETIQKQLFVNRNSKSFFLVVTGTAGYDDAEAFVAGLKSKAAEGTSTTSKWSFPSPNPVGNKIPNPKAFHTLVYLLFLTGPAEAWKEDQLPTTGILNPGLENLCSVIRSQGTGTMTTVDQDCYAISDERYKQTVS